MKIHVRLAIALLFVTGFSSCLLKEPVFTAGFSHADPALAGVWTTAGEDAADPREREYAVLVATNSGYTLHYPSGEKDGFYFEAQPLHVGERDVWQLRYAASFKDGVPAADSPIYTLVWIQKQGDGKISIRSLKGQGTHTASGAAVRKAVEARDGDWEQLFGEAKVFERLADK